MGPYYSEKAMKDSKLSKDVAKKIRPAWPGGRGEGASHQSRLLRSARVQEHPAASAGQLREGPGCPESGSSNQADEIKAKSVELQKAAERRGRRQRQEEGQGTRASSQTKQKARRGIPGRALLSVPVVAPIQNSEFWITSAFPLISACAARLPAHALGHDTDLGDAGAHGRVDHLHDFAVADGGERRSRTASSRGVTRTASGSDPRPSDSADVLVIDGQPVVGGVFGDNLAARLDLLGVRIDLERQVDVDALLRERQPVAMKITSNTNRTSMRGRNVHVAGGLHDGPRDDFVRAVVLMRGEPSVYLPATFPFLRSVMSATVSICGLSKRVHDVHDGAIGRICVALQKRRSSVPSARRYLAVASARHPWKSAPRQLT